MNTKTILVVDDYNDVAEITGFNIKLICARAGQQTNILLARDIGSALQEIGQITDLDLLVTDWDLEDGVSGKDIIMVVKERFPLTRVVIHTGGKTLGEAEDLMRENAADAVLLKPATIDQSREVLRKTGVIT